MKILFDYQIFERQKFGGISRYFFELITQIDADQTIDWELPILYSHNHYLSKIESIYKKLQASPAIQQDSLDLILEKTNFPGHNILKRVKERLSPSVENRRISLNKAKSIQHLKEGNFDVFHPTYYDDYFLEHIGSKPYVLTVYDLIHQLFPELYLNATVDKSKEMIEKASIIMAISESTKRDLVSIYNIPQEKVVVTHLATSLDAINLEQSPSFSCNLPSSYLLFVGDRHGYKNFFFFAQAFAIIARQVHDLCIVCTGTPFNEHEINYFRKLDILDKVNQYSVNDEQLAFLYKNAVAFVFPSLYEGFGIPILESFSCQCPVLVSNNSSLTEIGGDAVLYFEPKNISTLIHAIEVVLQENGRREELISKGLLQLHQFSWEKNFRQTKQLYKRVQSET